MNPKAVCPDLPLVSAEVPWTCPNQSSFLPLSAPLFFTSTCSSSPHLTQLSTARLQFLVTCGYLFLSLPRIRTDKSEENH